MSGGGRVIPASVTPEIPATPEVPQAPEVPQTPEIPQTPTGNRPLQELPRSFRDLTPQERQAALAEIEQFAANWDGKDPHSLNAFARRLKADYGISEGHTKNLVKDLANSQQPVNQQPNTQPTHTYPNENANSSLNLGNIQQDGYYVVSTDVARSLGLGSRIVLGAHLRIALADNAGTLSPQVRASLRASIGELGVGVDAGLVVNEGRGGLFGGLQSALGVPATNTPVGTIDGQPVYQNALGQLVYGTGAAVSEQAQARLVGPDGQPVTGLTSSSQASTGVVGTATGLTGSTTVAASPSTGAPATGPGLTHNEAAAGTPVPGTPTTSAPTGGVTPTGVDPAAASAAATQVGATTATTTGGSRATAAATAQANAPGAQFAHNPGGPPPWAPAHGYRGHGGHPAHGEAHGNLGKGLIDGVQQLLSELLGMRVSRGQTQQFVNQLSQAELSAFLANPTQPQPGVMSTLMSVVMRDHGKPHHVGRDAVLALFDHLMSRNPSAREIYNFFKSLTPEQIEQLVAHRAEMIGNLPGVPQEVRVAANVQRIEAELTVMQGSRDPAAQRRAQTLEQLLSQNAQILHFDNAPDGRLAAGRISQVFGNLAEAKYVGLMIPGLNNTMDNFSARAQRGQLMHQLAQPMAREGTAMVVWLERLGQEVLRQYKSMLTAWQAREQQTRAPMTFQQALANAARQLAQETVPGMMLRGDARLTFVGHSFGSLIAKESLNQGAKPDACVFLGMPENRLKKIAAQAGCGDVDLYSMVADGDTVDEAVAADEAPEAAEAAGLDEEIDRLDPGKDLVPPIEATLDPHDNYGLEGSASLAQIVGVTLGWRPKLLPPEPSVITLYRSADGTYEDQAEPVGWFGSKGEEW